MMENLQRGEPGGRRLTPLRPPGETRKAQPDPVVSFVVAALFFVGYAINTYLVEFAVGPLPIRIIYMLALLVLLGAVSPVGLRMGVTACRPVLFLLGYLAIVGMILSVWQGELIAGLTELVAVHVQVAVLLLTSAIGVILIGPRRMIWTFAMVIGGSAFFSFLQWIGIGPAFAIRAILQYANTSATDLAISADRASGLSYSTILLANEACMTFALMMFLAMNHLAIGGRNSRQTSERFIREWRAVIFWSAVLFFVSLIGGNRSPVLGLIVFMTLFLSARRPRLLLFTLPAIIGLYFIIDPVREALAGAGFRVGETGDKSADLRWPMTQYGFRLFLANPLGYGLGFDSESLSNTVYLGDIDAVLQSREMRYVFAYLPIHNWWMNILNIYGLFLLPVVVYLWVRLRVLLPYLLFFTPYLVHITFHAAGPLFDDYKIWIPIGIIVGTRYRMKKQMYTMRDRSPLRPATLKHRGDGELLASPKPS